MKNCTPLWREAHFEVKMYKTHHSRTTFGSCDVEEVHAVVVRSTFRSQNVQSTPASDDFWKLRCRRRCTPLLSIGPLLEVELSKKCTQLRREAHFEVKKLKTPGVRTSFGGSDVEKMHAVVARSTFASEKGKKPSPSDHFWAIELSKKCTTLWREDAGSTFRSQNVKSTRGSDHFWNFRCRFAWQAQGIVHLVKSEQNMMIL